MVDDACFANDKNNAHMDLINFLKKQNAEVRDKDFCYVDTKSSVYLFEIIPMFTLKKSRKTVKGLLFGIVPVYINGGEN